MKRFFKVFLVALLSLTTAATLLACDKENKGDTSTPDVSKIVLVDKTVEEDGNDHSIMIQGTLPEGVSVTYTGNNQKAVGTYTVKAFLHYNGKVIKELSATLTITAATLPDVTTPDVTTPDVTTPDVTTPDVTTSDVITPEVTTPEVTTPEVTTPDVTTPDVTTPDVTTPDVTTPEPETDAMVAINGVKYPMVSDSGASLPGLQAAFMALGLEVSAGDEIAFFYNGVELTTGIGPDPDDTTNNIPNNVKSDENWSDVTFNIINGGVVDVYFKVWADGHSFWVTGGQGGSTPDVTTPDVTPGEVPTTGYHLVINGTVYVELTKNNSAMDPSYTEYYALGVEFAVGDIVTLYNADEGASWAIETPDSYSSGVWTGGVDGIECGEAGVYDVYVKMKYQADQIYFGQ